MRIHTNASVLKPYGYIWYNYKRGYLGKSISAASCTVTVQQYIYRYIQLTIWLSFFFSVI